MDHPFCGCMNDEVIEDFNHLMKKLAEVGNSRILSYHVLAQELGFDEKYVLALCQVADTAGLVTHGISIRFVWLTQDGRRYVDSLK